MCLLILCHKDGGSWLSVSSRGREIENEGLCRQARIMEVCQSVITVRVADRGERMSCRDNVTW